VGPDVPIEIGHKKKKEGQTTVSKGGDSTKPHPIPGGGKKEKNTRRIEKGGERKVPLKVGKC